MSEFGDSSISLPNVPEASRGTHSPKRRWSAPYVITPTDVLETAKHYYIHESYIPTSFATDGPSS
jgi:hypothetical protein